MRGKGHWLLGIVLMLPVAAGAQPSYTTNVIADAVVDAITDTRVADLDGDGELDIVFCDGGPYDNVSYMDNDGGMWIERLIYDGYGDSPVFDVGDIDGDGHLDLAIAHNAVLVWTRNLGQPENPAFAIDTLSTGMSGARRPVIVDLNGDGHADIAAGAAGDGTVRWFESDGSPADGGWMEHTIDADAGDVCDLAPADLDGDGDTDLAFVDQTSDLLGWYENADGSGTSWTEHVIAGSLTGAHYLDTGDLDLDGDPDLAVAIYGLGDLMWYANDGGAASWTAHTLDSNLPAPYAVTVGDINDDGDLDIVAASATNNSIVWFDNTSRDFASFTSRTLASGNSPRGIDIGDLDGDGDTDAAIGSTMDDDLLFASADGTPTTSAGIASDSWRIIGIPYALNTPAHGVPGVLFKDDIQESYGVPNWLVSRYDMASGTYIRFNEFDAPSGLPLMDRGFGYWFKQTDGKPVRLDIVTHQFDTNQSPITLADAMPAHDGTRNGYGMFANPFDASYDVSQMTFTADGLSWADVIDEGAFDRDLNANIYTWDGNQYTATSYLTATLDTWEGFWLIRTAGSGDAIDVTFPAGPALNVAGGLPAGLSKDDAMKTALRDGFAPGRELEDITLIDFRIGVSTADGAYYDTQNRAGFMTGTHTGYDPFDALELNSPGSPFVQLYFSHPDDEVDRLSSDFRGGRVLEQTWDVDVRTWGLPGEPLELQWWELDDLPDGVKVELSYRGRDDLRQPIGYLDELGSYSFTSPATNGEIVGFQLRLVTVDDNEILSDVELATANLPEEYGIQRAYPNPFNSQLNLDVYLPQSRNVTVSVHDVTGREVATVVRGPLGEGSHRLAWNGQDLAAGVYFVRMTSALGTSTHKVMLLK